MATIADRWAEALGWGAAHPPDPIEQLMGQSQNQGDWVGYLLSRMGMDTSPSFLTGPGVTDGSSFFDTLGARIRTPKQQKRYEQRQADGAAIKVNRKQQRTEQQLTAQAKAQGQAAPPVRGQAPAQSPVQGVQQWAPLVQELAAGYGVPVDVALGVMEIESGGNPGAVSPAGAQGLMQVMPFHFQPGEDPLDPETNVSRGLQILANAYRRFGNWDSAAAAYFGAVDAMGRPTGGRDATGTSGVDYVTKFRAARGRYLTGGW